MYKGVSTKKEKGETSEKHSNGLETSGYLAPVVTITRRSKLKTKGIDNMI